MPEHCPTCGSVVSVVTADEGTSSFRPVAEPLEPTDAMVQAAGQALQRYMVGDEDTECVPRGATIGVVDGWIRAIDAAVETAMPVVLTAAIPHLVTDEAVERVARELHRLSDDVLPFDLGPPHDPWRSVKWNDTRSALIDRRRERHLTTARAALEAALGGAA